MRHALLSLLLLLPVLLPVLGCSGKRPVAPADVLWKDGNQAFDDEAYERAIEQYKALLDQHPFDPNVEEAELKVALSYFLSERYAEAVVAFGDFERMHPTSDRLAMVEYHLGLCYLAQASTSDRDQQSVQNALQYFRNMSDRFPGSPWAEKAALRAQECRESLASHERDVACYYLRRGNLIGAEARLRTLLSDYLDTTAAVDALTAFADAYDHRSEADLATLARATIVAHHPDTPEAVKAREALTGDSPQGDPLPELMARLSSLAGESERHKVPPTVSAYPNTPGGGPTSY